MSRRLGQWDGFPSIGLGKFAGGEAPDNGFFSGEVGWIFAGFAVEVDACGGGAAAAHGHDIWHEAECCAKVVGEPTVFCQHVSTAVENEAMAITK